jgi:hypothetical protein
MPLLDGNGISSRSGCGSMRCGVRREITIRTPNGVRSTSVHRDRRVGRSEVCSAGGWAGRGFCLRRRRSGSENSDPNQRRSGHCRRNRTLGNAGPGTGRHGRGRSGQRSARRSDRPRAAAVGVLAGSTRRPRGFGIRHSHTAPGTGRPAVEPSAFLHPSVSRGIRRLRTHPRCDGCGPRRWQWRDVAAPRSARRRPHGGRQYGNALDNRGMPNHRERPVGARTVTADAEQIGQPSPPIPASVVLRRSLSAAVQPSGESIALHASAMSTT